jgi:aromatic-L-amino-acid decarboxylase
LNAHSLDELRRRCGEPLPHPDVPALRSLGTQVLDWALHHFATLPEQGIGRSASRQELEALLAEPPPEEGEDFSSVLDEFQAKVSPHAFRVNHPRFLAFIPGAPSFLSVLGDMLCASSNFFAGVWIEGAGPAMVELVVLDWFRQFLGMPPSTSGLLTSGGSEANLTALVVAREQLAWKDRSRAILYVTAQRHNSVDRAARIMGLHPEQLRLVSPAAHHRLTPERLHPLVQQDRAAGLHPWAVVANAGATNTGTVDPLASLADFCAAEKLWFHVDAAYGWAAALTGEGKAALAGIERADSVTLDPHKWLAQTFECGGLLVRAGRLLDRTFTLRAEYLQDVEPASDEVNFSDHGIALTRRFKALKVWLSIKVLGVSWFRSLIQRCCDLAELAQQLLEAEGFEITSPRQLSLLCFRHVPRELAGNGDAIDAHNLALAEALRASQRAFLSTTRLEGRVVLRLCFVNWRTTTADVEEVVGLLVEHARGDRP